MKLRRAGVKFWALYCVVAVVAVGGCASSYDVVDQGSDMVTAVFTDASPLLPGFTVRSHGVKVGDVESIQVHDGQAWVRMRVDAGASFPLHNDATASIRPVSLLGERYVDFDRGSPNAPVVSADQPIPASRTSSAVDLSDVLNAVDNPTGTAMAALITTLGEGSKDRGEDIDSAIATLAPSMHRTDGLVTILNQQNALLDNMIDRAAPVSKALAADDGRDLDKLLASMDLLLRTTTADQQMLDATIKRMPGTLADARQTLTRLAGVSENGAATLGDLRPFTDRLPQVSDELSDFSRAADPALATLDPVLKHGRELMEESEPLVRTLRPASRDLRSVSASTKPIVSQLDSHLGEVLSFLRDWSMCTNGFDGLTNYFRGTVIADPTMVSGLLPGGLTKAVPTLPGPVDQLKFPAPAEKVAPSVPLLGEDEQDPDSATGLSQKQEQGVVDQLLGGG